MKRPTQKLLANIDLRGANIGGSPGQARDSKDNSTVIGKSPDAFVSASVAY
jgi:hypothetical protein